MTLVQVIHTHTTLDTVSHNSERSCYTSCYGTKQLKRTLRDQPQDPSQVRFLTAVIGVQRTPVFFICPVNRKTSKSVTSHINCIVSR